MLSLAPRSKSSELRKIVYRRRAQPRRAACAGGGHSARSRTTFGHLICLLFLVLFCVFFAHWPRRTGGRRESEISRAKRSKAGGRQNLTPSHGPQRFEPCTRGTFGRSESADPVWRSSARKRSERLMNNMLSPGVELSLGAPPYPPRTPSGSVLLGYLEFLYLQPIPQMLPNGTLCAACGQIGKSGVQTQPWSFAGVARHSPACCLQHAPPLVGKFASMPLESRAMGSAMASNPNRSGFDRGR